MELSAGRLKREEEWILNQLWWAKRFIFWFLENGSNLTPYVCLHVSLPVLRWLMLTCAQVDVLELLQSLCLQMMTPALRSGPEFGCIKTGGLVFCLFNSLLPLSQVCAARCGAHTSHFVCSMQIESKNRERKEAPCKSEAKPAAGSGTGTWLLCRCTVTSNCLTHTRCVSQRVCNFLG